MAKKQPVRFICTNCGANYPAWVGRCSTCGEWNTLQEETRTTQTGRGSLMGGHVLDVQSVDASASKDQHRLVSGIDDIDVVLGGGIVGGSVILLAGQPGIGKSTILLQLAYALAQKAPILYISGEESAHQVGLRAKRLGVHHELLTCFIYFESR